MSMLIFSPCSCVSILDSRGLRVIDSENLPISGIQVLMMLRNGVVEEIFETFSTIGDFVDYLNSQDYNGSFTLDEDGIFYSNPEGFTTLEVVAILKTKLTVLKVGDPSYSLTNTPVLEVGNGSVFSVPNLAGVDILSVDVGKEKIEPSSENGYRFYPTSQVIDLSGYGGVQDNYVYIEHTQSLTATGDSPAYTIDIQTATYVTQGGTEYQNDGLIGVRIVGVPVIDGVNFQPHTLTFDSTTGTFYTVGGWTFPTGDFDDGKMTIAYITEQPYSEIPADVLLTEDGFPLTTEAGQFITIG